MTAYEINIFLLCASFALNFNEEFLAHASILPYENITLVADEYVLPQLPYNYDDLEPHMDAGTVRVHHTGHHAAYTRKMNAVLSSWRAQQPSNDLAQKSILEILKNINSVPANYRTAIKNNGGGFVNHALFWAGLSANPSATPREPQSGRLRKQIEKSFGNYSNMKEEFTKEALSLFGSGYVWLSSKQSGELVISPTTNQDSVVSSGLQPLLVLDVWEHAYYLKYQNKRQSYVDAWWTLVDWQSVDRMRSWWQSRQKDEL